jgi:hypothetical protein
MPQEAASKVQSRVRFYIRGAIKKRRRQQAELAAGITAVLRIRTDTRMEAVNLNPAMFTLMNDTPRGKALIGSMPARGCHDRAKMSTR